MFNSVNNPFSRAILSSATSDNNSRQQQKEQPQQEKKLLDDEEQDEVLLGGMPILTEDEISSMVNSYLDNLKSEYENNEKVLKKAEKWLEKFDVKKFMKNYPTITCSDFYIIMYMETESIRP